MHHTVLKTAIAASIAVFAVVGGAYYWLEVHSVTPNSESWPSISCRAQIYLAKAFGRVPELSWSELLRTTSHQGDFFFESRDKSAFKNGDSDLAIYRVLTDGVAGSSMAPTDLSFAERWQVVGYLSVRPETFA
jgi:hypothetical protein